MAFFARRRLGSWATAALIIVAGLLAALVAARLSVTFDWTANNRNSLTPASQRVLNSLSDGPITFTAYMYPGTARQDLRTRLARYTRADPRIHLVFRDPARHPQTVRKLGIGRDGAVVAAYQGRRTVISDYDEPSVTRALMQLSPDGNPWVVFVTGHGERAPNADDTGGYQALTDALDAQGLRVRTVNLASAQAVPSNTGLLVIASPQQAYLPGEVDMIKRYVAHGGNLLWVDDPGARYGLTPLAEALGVHFAHGTLVYPDYQRLGTKSPAIAVVANYPDTPVTRRLDEITLFPFAGGVSPVADSPWHTRAFIRSPARSWLETGPLDGQQITFQPDQGDQRGPQTIGLMSTRARPNSRGDSSATADQDKTPDQRIAVVADSDFMDNGHLNTLGNRTLALSIFQWLATRDDQIAIDMPRAVDARLEMAPARLATLRWLFIAGLPALLLAIGLLRWLIRRRR
ncbi:GldG family protein [Salinisphaera sp. Q1T1-3]|uniref:GldG family protein n=1 Tax=Salinisphaera sp. Q1T1-3 TaxID=2321229 RepID=UPI00131468EF|nr:DUF4350 domain-containing protein [Salinisphaera sp. Q1T1-3]